MSRALLAFLQSTTQPVTVLSILLARYNKEPSESCQKDVKKLSKTEGWLRLDVLDCKQLQLSPKETSMAIIQCTQYVFCLKAFFITCSAGYRENNFPPLPSKCPCKPCFFHDISIDIPIEYQKTCKALFFRWQGKVNLYCRTPPAQSLKEPVKQFKLFQVTLSILQTYKVLTHK